MSLSAWYELPGKDCDVVMSTRVRFARNLANFPFPSKLQGSDSERVRAIVFDAFNRFDDRDSFKLYLVRQLTQPSCKILSEAGILDVSGEDGSCGIVLRTDGKISCTVNAVDHVRIVSFSSGLDFEAALSAGRYVDAGLQKSMQFAASYDFGYLTSSLFDAGSGMKLSVRMHLPALSLLGKISSVGEATAKKGFSFTEAFGLGGKGSSLGAFYQIASLNCRAGSEFDQVASLTAAVQQLSEQERSAREQCMEQMPSTVRNEAFRAGALAQVSTFLKFRETVSIVSGLKLGVAAGLFSGVEDHELNALLYTVQEGALEHLLENFDAHFDDDVVQKSQQLDWLRAYVVREAIRNISFTGE